MFDNIQDLQIPKGSNIHFIGIGGSSMSGLAKLALWQGYTVSGSDSSSSASTDELISLGIKVSIGHNKDNIPLDTALVIYTLAISGDNPEYKAAIEKEIPLIERGRYLGILMKHYPRSIAIAGTHGKTTTTAMVASILIASQKDPTVHIGGILPSIHSNVRKSDGDHFVTEACEYHRNFLNLSPFASIILNIEEEHMDYYKDREDLLSAFSDFLSLTKNFSVICADSEYAVDIAAKSNVNCFYFGIENPNSDYIAADIVQTDGFHSFNVYKKANNGDQILLGRFSPSVPGRHNIYNALAAITLCDQMDCPVEGIARGLADFAGTCRRFEKICTCNGAMVIDDYAHHPTEIKATVKTAEAVVQGDIWCVFQPHTYSRAKTFLNDFPECFTKRCKIILTDIYAAREPDPGDINSIMIADQLNARGLDAVYIKDFDKITDLLTKKVRSQDIVLTLGAGTVNKIAYSIKENHKD